MNTGPRILHLEDDAADAQLIRDTLQRAGLEAAITVATDRAEFAAALAREAHDLILADYHLPGFNGEAALIMSRTLHPDRPFIFVTGALGEERAVILLKNGATDYVLKDRLSRLAPAIERALAETRERALRRRAEEEMRLARDQAEEANRAKDRFLAALSHELRTPLTPVLLVVSAQERSASLPPEVREDFALIRASIETEVRLIDDLLDLARVTQGKLRIELAPCDAHALVRRVEALVRGDMEAKRLTFTLDLAATDHRLMGDAVRLQQVLWNLLGNAVKFTPPGGAVAVRTWNEAGALRVAVTDTGIGIAAADLARVFDAFAQTHDASAPRFGGLGLGLSIAREIAAAHGGRVWAESAGVGQGGAFHLDLPLAAWADGTVPGSPAAPPSKRLRILIVEDHEATRETLQRLLARRGHRVNAAESAARARQLAADEEFDLVISDLGLPDGEGHELAAELRERHRLPVVVMSGFAAPADLDRSRAAGCIAHLVKPVSMEALEHAILTAQPADLPQP